MVCARRSLISFFTLFTFAVLFASVNSFDAFAENFLQPKAYRPSNSLVRTIAAQHVGSAIWSQPKQVRRLLRRNHEDGIIWKRTPEEYQLAVYKGECLMGMLQSGISDPSSYTNIDDLTSNGWSSTDEWAFFLPPLSQFIELQGLDRNDFDPWQFEYPQPWIPNGVTPRYVFWINIRHGVIIVDQAFAPETPLKPNNPDPDPRPLERLSDALFLTWSEACGGHPDCINNLNIIVHNAVSNGLTLRVAAQAVGGPYQEYPGDTLEVNEPDGQAFIGVPNGFAQAYLLMTHRSAFPGKTITFVNAFRNDVGLPCLAYMFGLEQ